MRIARLTSEGKVIFALWDAPMQFGSLKVVTGLSGAWLARTLKQLDQKGIIKYDVASRTYAIKRTEQLRTQVSLLMSVHLGEVASRIAEELARDKRVLAVILFGSVAMGEATRESDLDLLVVLEEFNRGIEDEFTLELSDLGFKFSVPIELVLLSQEDFESTLASDFGLIFGLARGYEVLYDRAPDLLTKTLYESVLRVRGGYSLEEGEVWLPKKELTARA